MNKHFWELSQNTENSLTQVILDTASIRFCPKFFSDVIQMEILPKDSGLL